MSNNKWNYFLDENPKEKGSYLCYTIDEDGEEDFNIVEYYPDTYGWYINGIEHLYWIELPEQPNLELRND